jgi:hypothetical protein
MAINARYFELELGLTSGDGGVFNNKLQNSSSFKSLNFVLSKSLRFLPDASREREC